MNKIRGSMFEYLLSYCHRLYNIVELVINAIDNCNVLDICSDCICTDVQVKSDVQ